MTAINVGWNAALNAYRDPGSVAASRSLQELADEYSLAWAYYRNNSRAVYSEARRAALRAAGFPVYYGTHLVYNPCPPVVSFYEDHLFTALPRILESGAALATPVGDGADEALLEALAQLDQWGNWLSEAVRLVRFGAVTGSVGCEVVDELDREKVTHRILWPSHVAEVGLDNSGNAKFYALEYKVRDGQGNFYTYRKEVDGEFFRYFRDGKPFDPPDRQPAAPGGSDGYRYNDATEDATKVSVGVYVNPYEFVPFVWAKHTDDGDARGLPAVWNLGKVDEINSLACHQHDRTHKGIEAPKVLITGGKILPVTGAAGESVPNQAGGISLAGYDPRNDWTLLKMPDGEVGDLDSGFDPTKADPQIERLLKSFESDYPELQAAEIIKNKAQLSGAALERMLAPSQAKLDRAFVQYGQQVVKLRQMGVAIAGYRYNGGGWAKRDEQQAKFAPFNLNSYAEGKLNFGLKRPLLVQSTPMEEEEFKAKRMERAKAGEGIVDPLEQLIIAGYSEAEAKEIIRRKGAAASPVGDKTGEGLPA